MASNPRICAIGDCGRALSPQARSAFCPRCRSGLGYWRKKTPKQRVQRVHTLRMLSNRMVELS